MSWLPAGSPPTAGEKAPEGRARGTAPRVQFLLQKAPANNARGKSSMAKQIGYAVVGLGDITQQAVLPAFARAAENSRPVAVGAAGRARAQTVAQDFRAAAYHY